MNDQAHEVEGYGACRTCGEPWVLREILSRTGQICVECLIAREHQPLRRIEVIGRGVRLQVPLTNRKRRHRPKTKNKAAEKAKERARKRLAAMFPDFFDIILAEERAKAGLKPWTMETAIRSTGDGSETSAFLAVYHALDEIGYETS